MCKQKNILYRWGKVTHESNCMPTEIVIMKVVEPCLHYILFIYLLKRSCEVEIKVVCLEPKKLKFLQSISLAVRMANRCIEECQHKNESYCSVFIHVFVVVVLVCFVFFLHKHFIVWKSSRWLIRKCSSGQLLHASGGLSKAIIRCK